MQEGSRKGDKPSCHLGEHMVCIIQMGRVGSRMATPMLAKHREPADRQIPEMWYSLQTYLFFGGEDVDEQVSVRSVFLPALMRMYGSFNSVSNGVPSTLWNTQTRAGYARRSQTGPEQITSDWIRWVQLESGLTPGEIFEGCRMNSCNAAIQKYKHRDVLTGVDQCDIANMWRWSHSNPDQR